jgi:hypothetical protein
VKFLRRPSNLSLQPNAKRQHRLSSALDCNFMDYKTYFIDLINGFLSGKCDREAVARQVSGDIGIDEIDSNASPLFSNCEWALRHMNEKDYHTTENELRYYLSCLRGEREYKSNDRDLAIEN